MWVKKAISCGEVNLRTPSDLAKLAEEKYATPTREPDQCKHFQVEVNFVPVIRRSKSKSNHVKNTRQQHMWRNLGCPGWILVKDIGCLCAPCVAGVGECENSEYFLPWRLEKVGIHPKPFDGDKLWSSPEGIVHVQSDVALDEEGSVCDVENSVQDTGTLHNDKEHLVIATNEEVSWAEMQRGMAQVATYADLKKYCGQLSLPALSQDFRGKFRRRIHTEYALAKEGLKVLNISSNLHAVSVKADGNCFLRSLSLLKFDCEEEHVQLRVRLVAHAVLNEAVFLDNNTFVRGCHVNCDNFNFTMRYSQYSEEYNPCIPLDAEEIQNIYQREWLAYRLLDCWSGVYQLHVAADCLQVQLNSHYPNRVIRTIFEDLNRVMFPVGAAEPSATLDVLWTQSAASCSRLDHFVPLLRMTE